MTLIVTLTSKNKVVQASDRRLTLNGKLYDDHSNKAVSVICDDAIFSVAYTGLAEIQHKDTRHRIRTDRWIADTLWNLMQDGNKDIRSLFYAFAGQTEETYRKMRLPLTNQGTTFVFAGFFYRSRAIAFKGTVSNFIFDAHGNFKVNREFRTDVQSFRLDVPDHESTVSISGSIRALLSKDAMAKSVFRQTRRMHDQMKMTEREGVKQGKHWVADQLVQIIRMASHHPEHGKYINRDCMAVHMMPYADKIDCIFYPGDNDSSIGYVPILVNQNGVFEDRQFELPSDDSEVI
jgi:hypothetical protein